MLCPKCGYQNPPDRQDCSRCGVIFAKIKVQGITLNDSEAKSVATELPDRARSLRHLLLSSPAESNILHWTGRVLVLLGMTVWGAKLIFAGIANNTSGESWMHLVNLPFHEAGHMVFRPFGQFLTSLGGTLGQLLVPLVCMAVLLLKTRDTFGAAVCLWWFGENFLDIAPYMNDARAGRLPLLGGNFGHSSPYGFHDWEYLLTETRLLPYDQVLALLTHAIGSMMIALSVGWGGYLLYRQFLGR